jgi:ubiquinone/menaquinone biosynthesis C-methylase UbiE
MSTRIAAVPSMTPAMADRAVENPYRYSLTTRLKEDICLKMLDIRPGDRVLDVGCGNGFFTGRFRDHGVTPYGIEFSPASLNVAKRTSPGYYAAASAEAIPFRDDYFDKILFSDVIEHLADDNVGCAEIARVTRKGATVVVTTPSMEGKLIWTKAAILCHDVPGTPEYHYKRGYTRKELVDVLGRHGIRVVEVKYSTAFIGELFIQTMKRIYARKTRGFGTQADLVELNDSLLFKIYRTIGFPVMHRIALIEQKLLWRLLNGHLVIVKGIVEK